MSTTDGDDVLDALRLADLVLEVDQTRIARRRLQELHVYTIFMIPGGWFIDRHGPRIALACMGIGSAVFCAFTGAIGFGFVAGTRVWFALLLVRSMMGLLSAPLHPGAARTVGNWFPSEGRALANGLITGASIFAYAVVHQVFGKLIDVMDWPRAFVATGAITAALAATWYVLGADYWPSVRSKNPPVTSLCLLSVSLNPGVSSS